MLKPRSYANNVSEFLTWVAEVKNMFNYKEDDALGPWFRGQQRDWPLYPKLYRGEYGEYAWLKKERIEDEIREQFITQAHIFCETKPAGDDDWEWYFLMQHFGAPTRLLDWTEGALLGLYFAVRGNPGFYKSVVWALDPYALNKKSVGRDEVIPPSATGVHPKDKKLVAPWLPIRFKKGGMARLPDMPIAVFPTHIARRISSQRSGFTLHGKDLNGLNERKNSGRLFKIMIPSFRVVDIRRELEDCGINEATIFPDLEGLGRSLCLKWQSDNHKDPHEEVYTRLRPSPIHGVGVFAIRKIKKGTLLFQGDNEEMLWIEESRLPNSPGEISKLYYDFPVIKEKRYGCPLNFNRLTMSWYLNEPKNGDRPNVYCDPESYDFSALRDIKPGEELTVKYEDYSELPARGVLKKSIPPKTSRKFR